MGPTHPKKGVRAGGRGGGGRKKKVRDQNTRDQRGNHRRQTDKDIRAGAGTRTKKYSFPNRGGGGRLPRLSSPACFGGAKKGKYQKWGDDRHMEVGQDRELYPNLPLIGVVLHSVPHQRQKGRRQRATKSGLERGWCGRIKKERPVHSFFRPIDTSAES